MPKKVCPLNLNRVKKDVSDCVEERCAWWNDLSKQCAIVTIAQGLLFEICESEAINDAVASVEDKS